MNELNLSKTKESIAKKYFEHFYNKITSEEAVKVVNDIVSNDFVDFAPIPGLPANKEGFIKAVSMINGAFFQKYSITNLFSDGNVHTGVWKASVTHIGEFMGISATNRTFEVEGITIYEVENNKIIKHWEKFDLFKIMNEISAK
ncbi:MAG: ester cyclase [Flavobacteriaceae bacterium]|nr:ester cyclase [Flavobacteriaceae bacterium]